MNSMVETIANADDLRRVAALMKHQFTPDDDHATYTKTKKDAQERFSNIAEEVIKTIMEAGCTKLLIMPNINKRVSVSLTMDGFHGQQWHMSMCEQTKDGRKEVDLSTAEYILNGFFGNWRKVPNPGMMKEIVHFVGND